MSGSRKDPGHTTTDATHTSQHRGRIPRDMSYDDPTQRRIGMPSMLQSRPRAMSLQGRPRPAPPPPQPEMYRGAYAPFANRGPYVPGNREKPTGLYWQCLGGDDSDTSESSESSKRCPIAEHRYIPFANRGPYVNERVVVFERLQSPALLTDSSASLPDLTRMSPISGRFSDPDPQATVIDRGHTMRENNRNRNHSVAAQITSPQYGALGTYPARSTAAVSGVDSSSTATVREGAPQHQQEDPNDRFLDPPEARNLLDRNGNFTHPYAGPSPGDDDPIRAYPRPRSRSFSDFKSYNYPDFREVPPYIEIQDIFRAQNFTNDLSRGCRMGESSACDNVEEDYDENGSVVVEVSVKTDSPISMHLDTPIATPNPSTRCIHNNHHTVPRRPSNPQFTAYTLPQRYGIPDPVATIPQGQYTNPPHAPRDVGLGITYVAYTSRGTSAMNLLPGGAIIPGSDRPIEPDSARLRRPSIRHRFKCLSARITSRISRMKKPE